MAFLVESCAIGDIHGHMLHPYEIEGPVNKRQFECIADLKCRPARESAATGEVGGRVNEVGTEIDADD